MLLKIALHYKRLKLHIDASDGSMSRHDMDMIRETLNQIGAASDLD